MKATDYKETLQQRLKNPRYAAKLLQHSFEQSCIDSNWEAFGIVLQDVIAAQGNRRLFAKKAQVSRPHLYRMFGKNANPTIKTLLPILNNLGLKLSLAYDTKKK